MFFKTFLFKVILHVTLLESVFQGHGLGFYYSIVIFVTSEYHILTDHKIEHAGAFERRSSFNGSCNF